MEVVCVSENPRLCVLECEGTDEDVPHVLDMSHEWFHVGVGDLDDEFEAMAWGRINEEGVQGLAACFKACAGDGVMNSEVKGSHERLSVCHGCMSVSLMCGCVVYKERCGSSMNLNG